MEETQISSQVLQNIERALLLLSGKVLHVDVKIGFGYLSRFAENIHTNTIGGKVERNESLNKIEILSADGKVFLTADAYDYVNQMNSDLPKGSIVKLKLNDYMSVNDVFCGGMGVTKLADNLNFYKNNANVKAAIIEVNSGGGEGTAGQIMYNAVKDFKAKKPIISYVHNAGSAAYMGILPSTEIIASGPLSSTGSIGAFISIDKKMVKWFKENVDDIYSNLSEDKNNEWRAYMSGDSEPLKKGLDEYVSKFHDMVLENRNLNMDKKDSTLKGGMFIASDSKNRGLINAIGSEDLVLKRIENFTK